MGRPLKTSKFNQNAGIINPSISPYVGASVPVDQAYPAFSELEVPVPPVGPGPSVIWEGVVGGETGPNTSATYPVVLVTANIQLPSGAGAGSGAASIIRQKGARKYMVAMNATVTTNALVPGASYQIVTTASTNWTAVGAGRVVTIGEIFTATAATAVSLGTVRLVGTCILANAAPAAGQMTITYTLGGVSARLSKLTNKWLYDFVAGQTGNDIWDWNLIQQDTRYAANFFNDQKAAVKSGTAFNEPNTPTQQNTVDLALVNKQN